MIYSTAFDSLDNEFLLLVWLMIHASFDFVESFLAIYTRSEKPEKVSVAWQSLDAEGYFLAVAWHSFGHGRSDLPGLRVHRSDGNTYASFSGISHVSFELKFPPSPRKHRCVQCDSLNLLITSETLLWHNKWNVSVKLRGSYIYATYLTTSSN